MIITGRAILSRVAAFCFILALLVLYIPNVSAESDPSDKWAAESFSDPSYVVEMPESWKIQACSQDKSKFNVSLDQQMYRILAEPIRKYARKHSLNIIIFDATCGNSAGMLRRKMIEIGSFCCPPAARDRLPGLRFHTLGITAVAILTHPDNPIEGITLNQARNVFRGNIIRWSELTGPDKHPGPDKFIQPIGRLHCKTRPGHWRLLLKDEELFSINMREVGVIADMVLQVASNPNAIGHEAVWLALDCYKKKGEVKVLKINGYRPDDLEALLTRKYPLYKVLSITTWEGKGIENTHAGKLVDFIKETVENLDSKYDIVPVSRLKQAKWKFKGEELVGEPG